MYKIKCEAFKTESFSNGNSAEWSRLVSSVKPMIVRNGYENEHGGIKDLFYSLLQSGIAYTVIEDRAKMVKNILMNESYEVSVIDQNTGEEVL